MNYTKYNCPVCNKPFRDNDDVVVCPECGAPHHRECYAANNRCFYSDKHGQGYEFDNCQNLNQDNENTKKCPICGTPNENDSIFCNHCGVNLKDIEFKDMPFNNIHSDFNTQQPKVRVINFEPINPNEQIADNVTVGEVATFVQTSVPYYLRVFSNIKNFSKSRFNFGAFLFSGFYLLYRKQYKLGAIITLIMFATLITNIAITNTAEYTQIYSMLLDLSKNSSSYSDLLNSLQEIVPTLSSKELLICYLPSVLQIIEYFLMFFVGFIANRTYYKFTIGKIKEIKSKVQDQEEQQKLFLAHGGVNKALVVCAIIAYVIITMFFNF